VVSALRSTSREPEEFALATQVARRTRERVADQVRELIVEGDRMGGRAEVAQRITRLIEAETRIKQAKARILQAAEHGLPQQPHRHDEAEGRDALRSAVMSLAVACGAWCAGMDHDIEAARRLGTVPADSSPV
jgi:hypothetical protein